MAHKPILLVITGPTGVGKTAMAISMAQWLDTVIVSADSRQFFKEMSIGTAMPSTEELAAVKHHFIGHLSIHDPIYTIGDYEKDALTLLKSLFEVHSVVILTGGSSMYIKALCEGLDTFPSVPESVNAAWRNAYKTQGLEWLQSELQRLDPEYFAEVDIQNPHRLLRALSVCEVAGKPFSYFRKGEKKERPFNTVYMHLEMDRAALYERINLRVDAMMEAGLLDEVKGLMPYRQMNALQTVGYQELFDYLDGSIDLATAIENIKMNSRRYAKRQMTWIRKNEDWKPFHPTEFEKVKDWFKVQLG